MDQLTRQGTHTELERRFQSESRSSMGTGVLDGPFPLQSPSLFVGKCTGCQLLRGFHLRSEACARSATSRSATSCMRERTACRCGRTDVHVVDAVEITYRREENKRSGNGMEISQQEAQTSDSSCALTEQHLPHPPHQSQRSQH